MNRAYSPPRSSAFLGIKKFSISRILNFNAPPLNLLSRAVLSPTKNDEFKKKDRHKVYLNILRKNSIEFFSNNPTFITQNEMIPTICSSKENWSDFPRISFIFNPILNDPKTVLR